MKRVWLIITSIVLIIAALYFIYHPLFYERYYFEKIGIKEDWRYQSIIANKGNPNSIIEDENENILLNYDGLTLVFGTGEHSILQSARIIGEQYRFGIWGIGIGTPRAKVERVYMHIRKIIDLPENEFGVIEGDTWVRYMFDENNCVSRITLTNGL